MKKVVWTLRQSLRKQIIVHRTRKIILTIEQDLHYTAFLGLGTHVNRIQIT